MPFPKSIALKAFEGSTVYRHPELQAQLTSDHANAIKAVDENYSEFCQLIVGELDRFPLMRRYFRALVQARLRQNSILTSGFIGRLLDEHNPTEERLERVHEKVRNFATLTSRVKAPASPNSGEETDELLLDIWSELHIMDLLLRDEHLRFTELQKVVRRPDQPKIDLLAKYAVHEYAIEITRIRKRDFSGSTLPGMFDAIYQEKNLESLRKILKSKLLSTDRQIEKFCKSEGRDFDRRLVVIKTSQWEYQDGSEVVRDEIRQLLSTGRFNSINEVLLVYDVSRIDWIK